MEAGDDGLIKFPRTRHIFDSGGGVGRDDLLMGENEAKIWYEAVVTVEEKVDGSNLGISITEDYIIKFQNRSHYVNTETQQQWRQLEAWAAQHPGIHQVLNPDRILFGEWMYAKHSIHYTKLPDLFLAFDIFDKKKGKFVSRKTRDKLLEGTGISTVPLIHVGKCSREDYERLLKSNSAFQDGVVEGVYVRIDEDENEGLDLSAYYGSADRANTGKAGKGGRGRAKGGKGGAQKKSAARNKGQEKEKDKGENAADSNGDDEGLRYLIDRSKIVRPDFLPVEDPDVTHWSRQMLVKNVVAYK